MFEENVIRMYEKYFEINKINIESEYNSFQDKFCNLYPKYLNASYTPLVFKKNFISHLIESTKFLLDTVYSIPIRIFNGNYKDYLNYLEYDKNSCEFLLKYVNNIELVNQSKLLARPDFLVTENCIKVIEMNIASAIGGIGILDRYCEIFYLSELNKYLEENGIHLLYEPVSRKWADFLIKQINKTDTERSLLMALLNNTELEKDNMNYVVTYEVLNYMRLNGFKNNFVGILSDLKFKDKNVYLKNKKIDVVLTSFIFNEVYEKGLLDLSDKLLESHISGNVKYFGSEISTIFDNKINLSILSDEKFNKYFTEQEKINISKLVPKTYKLTNEKFDYAKDYKDKLIVKNSISCGGKNVFIGKNYSTEDWEIKLEELTKRKTFIIQEIIEPRYRKINYFGNSILESDICIGSCYFDGFAGILIREKPYFEGKTSIINCAKGAKYSAGLYI